MPGSSSSDSGSTSSLLSPTTTSNAGFEHFIADRLRAMSLESGRSGQSATNTVRSGTRRKDNSRGSQASSGSTDSLLSPTSLPSQSTTRLFDTVRQHAPGQTSYSNYARSGDSVRSQEDDLVSEASSTLSRPASHTSSILSEPHSLSDASSNLSIFADSASLFSLSSISSAEVRQTKLHLWQSFLLDFGLCRAPDGTVRNIVDKPSHFPSAPLDLPTSLNACEKLIKAYMFLNLHDYTQRMHGELGGERFKLYESAGELARYTKKSRRYAKLPKVKEGYLGPFLRTLWFKHRLSSIAEGGSEGSGESSHWE